LAESARGRENEGKKEMEDGGWRMATDVWSGFLTCSSVFVAELARVPPSGVVRPALIDRGGI
jgi:hypothetical protein